MILIITHKTDYTADFVVNKLNQNKISYKRFNCEDILDYDCTIKYNNDFQYSILGERNYESVWFRRTKLPELNNIPRSDKLYILNETDSFIKNLFTVIDCKWVSQPLYVYEAENKLLQLKIAQNLGFQIPHTLITSSKEELVNFYNYHNKDIIIKPISQTKIEDNENPKFIFTNKVTNESIDNLNSFDMTPCIFQSNIEKDYEIRVTIVGNQIFAAAIDSQIENETKIDWRKKKLTFRKIILPNEVAELCIQIVNELKLNFGAIDLIKTKTNEYIFLEINPNGQWAWIENQTGLKISDAIIKELKVK
jgi:glutathione synthase/RimK-type ligase-like ATP-grasp enzyme